MITNWLRKTCDSSTVVSWFGCKPNIFVGFSYKRKPVWKSVWVLFFAILIMDFLKNT
jgi:hypothetical protein